MKQLAVGALFAGLLVACGGGDSNKIKLPDANPVDGISQCNPLTQAGCAAGEKCTWVVDAVMPQYVGHMGCATDGTKNVGEACTYGQAGATGYDDCKKGGVCSAFGAPGNEGVCKQVCDQQGGEPACDAEHVCVTYSDLFSTGEDTPAAAGVCDLACDPLLDNDFDGSNGNLSGSGKVKRSDTCGSAANVGCYGYPSFGSPPATGWSCTGDINSAATGFGLRHRIQCTDANGCTKKGRLFINSCNQGYLPLLKESSFVSTAVCISLCKPEICYKDNCGTNKANRIGAADDGCRDTDRVANMGFNNDNDDDGGEHCTHLWYFEVDNQGNYVPSPTSDTVGFCYDHHSYYFDSNGDGALTQLDTRYPNCGNLGSGVGTNTGADPLTRYGAVNLGCVPSTYVPKAANGKLSEELVKARAQMDIPRALYQRTMAPVTLQ